jgi:hypothetical protein
MKERGEAHRGSVDCKVLAVLEFDGEAFSAIFGDDKVYDGVQLETMKMIACRNRSFASCKREERWLKVSGASARCSESTNTRDAEGSERWCSYHEVQGIEVRLVARWWRMIQSTAARIVRRSSFPREVCVGHGRSSRTRKQSRTKPCQ